MKPALISLICIAAFLSSSSALAYKRDVGPAAPAAAPAEEAPSHPPAPWDAKADDRDDHHGSNGEGVVIAGYAFVILGGMAAIAGSTLWAASDNYRMQGAIVGGTGAALSLAGSMMVLFGGHSGYAVGPTVDPVRRSAGLQLAANF